MKEIFIGNYGLEQVGQTMTATGWVANIRNHGKLAFIELRDREGLLQVFVGGEIEDFAKLGETDPLFKKLADCCDAHNGLWNDDAEAILFRHFGICAEA